MEMLLDRARPGLWHLQTGQGRRPLGAARGHQDISRQDVNLFAEYGPVPGIGIGNWNSLDRLIKASNKGRDELASLAHVYS